MQANVRKREPPKPNKVTPINIRPGGGEIKQARKIPYRVGYSWNKGGRLKELRIRHLARKFLKKWMQETFGRVHPNKARSHYERVVLLRAFGIWRDEWWTNRREWSLTVRADCHYRYYQCNRTFHSWQTFVSLQREKKKKLQNAQYVADRQRMRLAWDRWEVFLEMRRMKGRMRKSALQQKRLTTLCSVWNAWQTKLQQHYDFNALEDKALQHWALTLQSRVCLQWREMYTTACSQKEKESKASLHFIHGQQRKALCGWMRYVHCRQAKKKPQDVNLCIEEAERTQIASQHQHNHLLHAGLRGLSLNVTRSKAHRLNKNVAVQHNHQATTKKYWRLWQQRIEEAEDKALHPQMETALTHYSTSLLTNCFHHWKEKLAEHRYIQGLEHHAETWFAERMLPRCFNAWVEFTLQRRLHREERESSETYNQRRQYTWVFYTWWERSEKRKEQRLSGRMAVLHGERWCMQKAWARWRQRTCQKMDDREKQSASDTLYLHRLLQKTLSQWKDNSTEIRDRRNQEEQASRHGDLRCMSWAMDGWQKFVENQRGRISRLEQMDHYHQVRLLKRTLQAWKEHHLQTIEIYGCAEERYRLHQQLTLRRALAVWRENTMFLAQARIKEQRAQSHYQHRLQTKVLLAWRQATSHAVSKHNQQREVVARAQSCIEQVWLRGTFLRWRKRTKEAEEERRGLEKARRHHRSTLLCRALKGWNRHHDIHQKYEVMKRQGALLLRLKTCQNYFECWKIELQHRRRGAEQTELALWHWSLGLQAKVLYAWRLWVTEQQRKRERMARAAHFYRGQLLREGVTHILTHAAHMSSLGANLAQRSQAQSSRRLQEVVQRCAMRWKQRALCRPGREQGGRAESQNPKKSVSFCLPTSGSKTMSHGTSWSDSVEEEVEDRVLSQLVLTRASRLQPRCPKDLLDTPVKGLQQSSTQRQSAVAITNIMNQPEGQQQFHLLALPHPVGPASASHQVETPVRSCLRPPTAPINPRPLAVTQSPLTPAVTGPEPHRYPLDFHHGLQNQDVLLPPSSFMATNTQPKLRKSSSSCPRDSALLTPHQFTIPFNQTSPTYSGACLRVSDEEVEVDNVEECVVDVESDPTSALTRELLGIREDMKRFQQDRKQIQAWQRLKEVLESWLQTSGKEEQMERNTISQELEELEEHIRRLSAEVAKQKPAMLLHAARVQRLESLLHSPGDDFLSRSSEKRSVLT